MWRSPGQTAVREKTAFFSLEKPCDFPGKRVEKETVFNRRRKERKEIKSRKNQWVSFQRIILLKLLKITPPVSRSSGR